jgi:hypothetical protein
MAAKTATNTAMSIKKAQAQREPAGRAAAEESVRVLWRQRREWAREDQLSVRVNLPLAAS